MYTARCLVLQHSAVTCRAPGSAMFMIADRNARPMYRLVVSDHPMTTVGHMISADEAFEVMLPAGGLCLLGLEFWSWQRLSPSSLSTS